jgi:hypothetical protein
LEKIKPNYLNMPSYLCHGFRWHRRSIRVYVVVQNIDDAAPEWIIAPESSTSILESFYSLFDFLPEVSPQKQQQQQQQQQLQHRSKGSSGKNQGPPGEFAMPPPSVPPEEDDVLQNQWSAVKLLEEYDTSDLGIVSRPYAYVADYVVRVDLSVSVVEEITRYEERMAKESSDERAMSGGVSDEYGRTSHKKGGGTGKKAGWFEKLRDQLQRGEDIRWYVVVCDDEVRDAPDVIERDPSSSNFVAQGQRDDGGSSGSSRGPTAPLKDSLSLTMPGSQQKQQQQLQYLQRLQQDNSPTGRHGDYYTPAMSREYGTPTLNPRPKTPKGGGLRRLFGRKHDESP